MATKQPIQEVTQAIELNRLIQTGARLAVNFHAPWAAPCVQMNAVFTELHNAQPDPSPLLFATVQAESLPDLTALHSVSTVPTFLFFASGRRVRRFSGADPAQLSANISWLSKASEQAVLSASCDEVIRSAEITLLMKGTPDAPRCGFSRQAVDLLRSQGVVFAHFDVLADPAMRAAIKVHADWPTYPMLFARGRLVGGIDILRELCDAGTLVEELEREQGDITAADSKPTQVEKKNGNSAQTGEPVPPPVAEPPVVASANGSSSTEGAEALNARLSQLTKRSEVMLFMKGSPEMPRCGFSRKIVEVLKENKVIFDHFDILEDPAVRAGLKTFSDWPTFPQLYAQGRFIGGLDVVKDLVEAGMFADELGLAAQV